MDTHQNFYDLVLKNGWVIDPSQGLNGRFADAIASVTVNPSRILKAEAEIGTLKVGSVADITILQLVAGEWLFFDSLEEKIIAKEKLIPVWVVRSGKFIQPNRRLLRDL